jgi:hypothetical protein
MSRDAKAQAVSLEEVRIGIVARLRSRSTEIEETIVARIRNVGADPARSGDVQYEAGQRMAVLAVLDYALTGIEHGEEEARPIPSEAVTQVRRAARNGVELDTIVRRYNAGSAELADIVVQEADRGGLLGYGAVLRSVQRTQASLLDHLIVTINDEYVREVQRVGRSPERRRVERVRRLLAGGFVDTAELDYELDAWHLGVIGTGVDVGRAFRGMAAGLGCQLLSVSHDERSMWAWLGGRRKAVVGGVERLVSARWPAGVSLAVGEPAEGLDGWRLTHWQAQDALLVALRRPQMLTLYADIALLVPWLRDDTRAQWLVEMHLSPLDNHRCSGATLRKTLREYFAAGHNASAAARALYISRRTMRNRMVLIEGSLGPLLHTHQAELELALRLDELREDKQSYISQSGVTQTTLDA